MKSTEPEEWDIFPTKTVIIDGHTYLITSITRTSFVITVELEEEAHLQRRLMGEHWS